MTNKKINQKVFEKFPELKSERLLYRKFNLEDAEDLFIIRSDEKVMRFMDSLMFTSITDAEAMIMKIIDDYTSGKGINWIISLKENSITIGYFGFWRIIKEHCRAEIGFALKPEYWDKGYMSETISAMLDFGFNNLKLHSIEANVNPLNKSCRALLTKAGFKQEAHFRENYLFNGIYHDSIIYSFLESKYKG